MDNRVAVLFAVLLASPAHAGEHEAPVAKATVTANRNDIAIFASGALQYNGHLRGAVEAGPCYVGERQRWEVEACGLLTFDSHYAFGAALSAAFYARVPHHVGLGGGATLSLDLPAWKPVFGALGTLNLSVGLSHSGKTKFVFEAGAGIYKFLVEPAAGERSFGPLYQATAGLLIRIS